MKKIISGIILTLAVAILAVSRTQAAESPNILVGQDMTVGSTGQSVIMLQSLLSEIGYLNIPAGVLFGFYGSLTRDAVEKYQAANGVTPTAGYYGPITKVAMRAHFLSRGWLNLLGW